ncbi:MAG: ATP-binding protein [Steroidobacteraceae bacterium]
MGYEFSTAVADVIDNSIEARATRILVDIEFDGDSSSVRIADNGHGMPPARIREALRFGSERDYDENDSLGKFGLGLKTASLSQSQRLTVASRSSAERCEIYAYAWDLDHVQKTDRWEIVEIPRLDQRRELRDPLLETTGTVVLWERLDRILGYQHPYGESAKKRLSTMCRELEEHLAMVFHRFMTGEGGGRKIKFLLNGNLIKPWDPFARQEQRTQKLELISLPYDSDGIKGEVVIEPYVLPHQSQFSSPEAHQAASGPEKWNKQQGLYIYRSNRMIQSGGWSNLRTLDEHLKLARVAVSFKPALDEAFKINVAKMKVQIPQKLREQFEKALGPVVSIANSTYRRQSREGQSPREQVQHPTTSPRSAAEPATRTSIPMQNTVLPFNSSPASAVNSAVEGPAGAKRMWTVPELKSLALLVATAEERPVVTAVLDRLEREMTDE